MKCPRCKKTMVQENREGEEILVCRHCDGMWLHKHQLNNLLKESGGDVELCSFNTLPDDDRHPIIKCRECPDSVMLKIHFLEYSDIVIDRCPSCGSYWLDKNELANMHKYISQVEEGSSQVKDVTAYDLLARISRIAYTIFH